MLILAGAGQATTAAAGELNANPAVETPVLPFGVIFCAYARCTPLRVSAQTPTA